MSHFKADADPCSVVRINCRLVNEASVLCGQCTKRKDSCSPPLEGMAGDALDLSEVLDSLKNFWDDAFKPLEGSKFTFPD
jgi:hypothetical protein